MKEKMLVTGGTGFIGYHILKKFKGKFSIISLSSKKPTNDHETKKEKQQNICDLIFQIKGHGPFIANVIPGL